MPDIFKNMSRQNYVAMAACLCVLIVSIIGCRMWGMVVDKDYTEVKDQINRYQTMLLQMTTTASQNQNDVIIENNGFDSLQKVQDDNLMISYLTSAMSFTDGEGYNTVRDALFNSLSQEEVDMLMPENVLIGEGLYQSDVDNLSLQMNGFNSTCTSIEGGYSYFATATFVLSSNGTPRTTQAYMMTYTVSSTGSIMDFQMYAVAPGV